MQTRFLQKIAESVYESVMANSNIPHPQQLENNIASSSSSSSSKFTCTSQAAASEALTTSEACTATATLGLKLQKCPIHHCPKKKEK